MTDFDRFTMLMIIAMSATFVFIGAYEFGKWLIGA